MNFKFFIFLFPLLASCEPQGEVCSIHSEREVNTMDEMLNSYVSYDHNKMAPPATFGQIIQYQAHDGWGYYSHTIRLYQENFQYIIELKSNMKKAPDWAMHTIRKKIEVKPEDALHLWGKTKLLFCKEVDLEPDYEIIDGDRCNLVIKDGDQRQGFTWQEMNNQVRYSNGRVPEHKDEVTEIVGDLMRLCEFPNGKKFIYIDSFNTSGDSVAFDIFLGYAYNVRDYKVYFDDKPLDKDIDRIAKVKMPVLDTSNLDNRIRIKATHLDKSEIEY